MRGCACPLMRVPLVSSVGVVNVARYEAVTVQGSACIVSSPARLGRGPLYGCRAKEDSQSDDELPIPRALLHLPPVRCSDDDEVLNAEEAQKRWAQTEKYAADLRKASSASPPKMRAKYTSRCFKMLVVSLESHSTSSTCHGIFSTRSSCLLHILRQRLALSLTINHTPCACQNICDMLCRLARQGLARQPSFRIWHLPMAHRMTVRLPCSQAIELIRVLESWRWVLITSHSWHLGCQSAFRVRN